MSFPIVLPTGVIAVYGTGVNTSPAGVISTDPFLYGSVYHVWDGGWPYVYGGDVVMFNKGDVINRINYGSATYTLIPARLVTKEVFIP